MGRPPSNGAPVFRFHPAEVAQMEVIMHKYEGHLPPRDLLVALAERFSHSPERAGKIVVQMKQIWNWFQNRKYTLRAKLEKSVAKPITSIAPRSEVTPLRYAIHIPQQTAFSSGPHMVRNTFDASSMVFEAKSGRDGAWYDVQEFRSHRYLETGNPEVLVRFSGFGTEEDEWLNIRMHVRPRSLPCEAPECIAVLPGDLVLCFQEGEEQALYFDAHVLAAQRMRHDIRGCRCRFRVRYVHDQSEEIVPLRKMCRRPETDYRLQQLHAANEAASSLGITNFNPGSAPITVSPPPITGVGSSVVPFSSMPAPTLDRPPNPCTIGPPSTNSISTSVSAPFLAPVVVAPATASAQISTPVTVIVAETSPAVPEQNKVKDEHPTQIPVRKAKVNSENPTQIPVSVTEPNRIETDNPPLLLESNKVEADNPAPASAPAPAPISVPEPIKVIKVENDTAAPVSVPERNKVFAAPATASAQISTPVTVIVTETSPSVPEQNKVDENNIGSCNPSSGVAAETVSTEVLNE